MNVVIRLLGVRHQAPTGANKPSAWILQEYFQSARNSYELRGTLTISGFVRNRFLLITEQL
jgi:hypothetical protein